MSELIQQLRQYLPETQVITDELRLLAYGTDASFYRLTPQVIAVIESETELQAVLKTAKQSNTPVTFRAAGTSLSGQAITDGILALIGEGFATCDINADASQVKVGPGIIGGEVNRRLAPFGKKIGPDPASINACKIGGIAANNASGMCCGTAQNSYRTVAGMRVMFADGTVLDTEDAVSIEAFAKTTPSCSANWSAWGATRATMRSWPSASATSSRSRTPPATASMRWSITKTRSTSCCT
jgi:D-lactate dehydrogenase